MSPEAALTSKSAFLGDADASNVSKIDDRQAGLVPAISSNGWPIPLCSQYFQPIAHSRSTAEVAAALSRNGFALIRNFVPEEIIAQALHHYRSLLNNATLAAISPTYGTLGHPAYDFVRSDAFDQLCRQPCIAALADALLGGSTIMLKRRVFRHYTGARPRASRSHRDWSYLDCGTDQIVVLWVPLTVADLKRGGLVYLEGSRNLDIRRTPGALKSRSDRADSDKVFTNDLKGLADMTGKPWRYATMQPGDVLIHDALIVHASTDCVPNTERISTDLRLVRRDADLDSRWHKDWSADDGY